MLENENSPADTFVQSLYTNRVTWFLIQMVGAVASIFLIRNPLYFMSDAFSHVINNPIGFQTIWSIVEILFQTAFALIYIFLIFFFAVPKKLEDFRAQIFFMGFVTLLPHFFTTQNISQNRFFSVSQTPGVDHLFYLLPWIVLVMQVHKNSLIFQIENDQLKIGSTKIKIREFSRVTVVERPGQTQSFSVFTKILLAIFAIFVIFVLFSIGILLLGTPIGMVIIFTVLIIAFWIFSSFSFPKNKPKIIPKPTPTFCLTLESKKKSLPIYTSSNKAKVERYAGMISTVLSQSVETANPANSSFR